MGVSRCGVAGEEKSEEEQAGELLERCHIRIVKESVGF
jgi:hypothetical protein